MRCFTIVTLLAFCMQWASAQCNGYPELCDKRFDEVAYPMTHNAFNAVNESFTFGNQTFGIARQLEDGVRGFMIDVYESDGEILVYHTLSVLGTAPLSDNLTDIKDFLDDNPTEIVSIIFESYVTSTDIENELTSVGLTDYLHHHTLGTPWATLQEMIDAGERLVVFSESNDGQTGQTWYHYAWDHTFDTGYSYSDPADFDCAVNRGSIDNDLYLVNHWITTGIGTGDSTQAAVVNANPMLIDRLLQCQSETGRFPNFVGVDFYHIGDVMQAVNTLNGVQTTPVQEVLGVYTTQVFPNPAKDNIWIVSEHPAVCGVTFRDILGRHIAEDVLDNGKMRLSTTEWGRGVYFYSLLDKDGIILESGQMYIN